jgi:hypothetical protein
MSSDSIGKIGQRSRGSSLARLARIIRSDGQLVAENGDLHVLDIG